MSGLLDIVPSFKKLRGSLTDDWIDRMNHLYTVALFVIFAVVVSTAQFVGDPIHCWCPAEFTDAFVDYTKYVCWVSNTYYLPMHNTIPTDVQARQAKEITYYQWVPLIFMFQCFLFKFPNIVWKISHGGSGLNLDKIVNLAEDTQLGSPEERREKIGHLAHFLDKWLDTHREYRWNMYVRIKTKLSHVCCFLCNKREGTYLTALFLFIKLLYVVNVIGQFFLLNEFMSTSYNNYGFEIIDHLSTKGEWRESPRFPRVTLCDFEIRQLQNVLRYTVQCVLPINLFNEKIFIFMWFWLFLVAALSVYNLIHGMFLHIFKSNRARYIKKYLKINNDIQSGFDKKLCQKFANIYLRDDGVFVLRQIAKNSTDLVVTDVIHVMFEEFKKRQGTTSNNSADPLTDDDVKEPLA